MGQFIETQLANEIEKHVFSQQVHIKVKSSD